MTKKKLFCHFFFRNYLDFDSSFTMNKIWHCLIQMVNLFLITGPKRFFVTSLDFSYVKPCRTLNLIGLLWFRAKTILQIKGKLKAGANMIQYPLEQNRVELNVQLLVVSVYCISFGRLSILRQRHHAMNRTSVAILDFVFISKYNSALL